LDPIADLFHSGLSIREIARKVGKTYGVVRCYLLRHGHYEAQHKRFRDGVAACKRCGQEKLKQEFPALIDGKYLCHDCLAQVNREVQERRQGCETQQYQALLDEQKGCCAICGASEGHLSCHGASCRLAIDHDHETGAIRGLLCNNCNRGLGRFKDSITLLEAAIRYLKREQELFRKSRSHS
jgi:hypothetical protein